MTFDSDLIVKPLKFPGEVDMRNPALSKLSDHVAKQCIASLAETIGVRLTREQLADLFLSMRDTDILLADLSHGVRDTLVEASITDAFAEHMLLRREPVSDHSRDLRSVRAEIRGAALKRGYHVGSDAQSAKTVARSWIFWLMPEVEAVP